MLRAAIAGIGRTEFKRESGRTPLAMAVEACRASVADAGLSPSDVDGMTCYMVQGDSAGPGQVSDAMGITELSWMVQMAGGGNLTVTAVAAAAAAIATGQCRVALVYRSLNGRSGHRLGRAIEKVTVSTAAGGAHPTGVGGYLQFGAPHGYLVPPQWFAMWAKRHQHVYGSTCEDLGAIAVTQRLHASKNAHAINRAPFTIDEYMDSRWINEPFRVLDCSYEIDGALALLLVGEHLAPDLARAPVWLVGAADSGTGTGWEYWDDATEMYSRTAAPRLWSRTGLGPSDIDVACMYDCFTYTVMCTMEDYGFCRKGEVGDFFREGRATYGGDVVVNPHGGLLSEGYLHGLNHHYEAVLQLRGEAEERQVPHADLALVTAGGGPGGGCAIYSREKP